MSDKLNNYNFMKMLCSKLSRKQIIEDLSIKCEELYLARESILKKDNEIEKLKGNWNSLRECIETDNKRAKGYIERIRTSDLCHGDYPVEYYYAEKRKEITDYYLDKMNELEGKDKE